SEAAADASNPEAGAHDHDPDGAPAPEGIQEATDPRYPVGEAAILNTDHMPGMDGAEATISGAVDTTTYSASCTPTDGGEPVTDHKWVVHEERDDPGEAPRAPGSETGLNADHMSGLKGAEATSDSAHVETDYM